LQAQADAGPLLRQAFEEQNTLAHLNKELAKRNEDQQQHETACAEGQALLKGLQEKHTHVAERLQRLAAGLERSAALAPLSEPGTPTATACNN